MGGILWIIIVGFVAGIIARLLSPGPNNPTGFILTTILGIAGAFLATFIGQAIGHYGPSQGRALSPPPSVRWLCCLSGIGSLHAASFPIRETELDRKADSDVLNQLLPDQVRTGIDAHDFTCHVA